MKQHQTTNQKPPHVRQKPSSVNQHPQPVQELTEEQLQQVVGGQPGDPCQPTDPCRLVAAPWMSADLTNTQIIIVGG